MTDEPPAACDFCDLDAWRRSDICLQNEYCLYASNADAVPPEILPGSGIIIPLVHRATPFDLSPDEWQATHALLVSAKELIDRRWRPDGYTVGWNCGSASGQEVPHAHLHVIPRFADEPQAGHGLRWAIKQPDNRRPDPSAAGHGATVTVTELDSGP